jgi:hypothetical protein
LPWSMWAMMQKLRISSGGVAPGWKVGDTQASSWVLGEGWTPHLPTP